MKKRGWISFLLAMAMLCVPLGTVMAETEPTEVETQNGSAETEPIETEPTETEPAETEPEENSLEENETFISRQSTLTGLQQEEGLANTIKAGASVLIADVRALLKGHIEITLDSGEKNDVEAALMAALDGESPADVRSIEISGVELAPESLRYLCDTLTALEVLSLPDQRTTLKNPTWASRYGVFLGHGTLRHVSLPSATVIGKDSFYGCKNLESIYSPNAETIGASAFEKCPKLQRMDLPKATSIEEFAFAECNNLERVDLPSVIRVDEDAFSNCKFLAEVNMPKVETIGSGAFSFCYRLKEIILPKAQRIDDGAFHYCVLLVSIELPEATYIGRGAFYSCEGLISVELPKVTSIESETFSRCTALESVTLPEADSIDDGAFANCGRLFSVSMPKAERIGENAFQKCEFLTSITIPATVTDIGGQAFADSGLKSIVFLGTTPPSFGYRWGEGIFGSLSQSPANSIRIYVPTGAITEYSNALTPFGNEHINEVGQIHGYQSADLPSAIDLGEDEKLFLGETVTKSAVFSGEAFDSTVIWTSINPEVASVDSNGTITAHRAGETEITAASTMMAGVKGSCTVTVYGPPAFAKYPQDQEVYAGKEAIFAIATEGEGVGLQWQVNANGNWTDIIGATESSYRMTATLEDNEKQYRCVASNKSGSVTSGAATLTVTQNAELPDYSFAGGAKYTKGSGEDLVLKIEKDFVLYDTMLINGAEPKEGGYDVKSGSTVVTLYSDYLDGLEVGRQEIRVLFSDGVELVASFEIMAEASGSGSLAPAQSDDGTGATGDNKTTSSRGSRTGDSSNMWLLLALGGAALLTGFIINKYKGSRAK